MNMKKTLNQYKDGQLVSEISKKIHQAASELGKVKLMHVCGTHEHEIMEHGLRQLLPSTVEIIPGPGCPVCICPVEAIDQAVTLSRLKGVTVLTFGDMIRVPATKESLDDARRDGGSVKMVYSALDAVKMAQKNPDEKFVFFSIGFETTSAGTAVVIKQDLPENLFFLMANRYIPPVFEVLMQIHKSSLQGFMLAGHAAVITGSKAYEYMDIKYKLPSIVTGFTPVDILSSILKLLYAIKNGEHKVINNYSRVVADEGNRSALAIMEEVFDLKPGVWRGIGELENTAFTLKEKYSRLDAVRQFDCEPPYPSRATPPGCQCHRVMLGEIVPSDCKMFREKCAPSDPYGPCMVSIEGTCHVWYHGHSFDFD